MRVETAAAHSVLILRSPPKAGVSKDGGREKLSLGCGRDKPTVELNSRNPIDALLRVPHLPRRAL
ncbi:hypothetical protein BwSH20_16330 [Bradyrhizobium ottawaense]|nr:hypothetical protein SG09_05250 [Bradyrhizobium ottawaense]BBO09653.1 hypothetical protein TM102_11230 [Bradyrhizobium sp. TM102]GMO19783.1 hypothetical protein BwSF12_09260 [Bradyrhizobium ottawaense]GMO22259.1 hypothetical protein BwSF21_17570 [Bradyrhizobium ottawaense]GMO33164.1 hypothetical protein BwSH14_36740 [Bradyrhizobium ottawaense]